jgi:hypothetical protein
VRPEARAGVNRAAIGFAICMTGAAAGSIERPPGTQRSLDRARGRRLPGGGPVLGWRRPAEWTASQRRSPDAPHHRSLAGRLLRVV